MTKKRENEIKHFVENDCRDWCELKLESIELKGKQTYLTVVDLENYKYFIDLCVLRHAKYRNSQLHKFFRNNSYTVYNIENYLKINNKSFTLVSDKVNTAKEFLLWNCPIHGEFEISWNTVKNGQGCPICGRIQAGVTRRNSIEYVRQKFEDNNLKLMTNEYLNNEQLLPYICPHHENQGIQYISYGNLIMGRGCPICGRERTTLLQTKGHEQFIKEVYELYEDKYEIRSTYINSRLHVLVYCKDCDKVFPIKPYHLLDNHGCPLCSSSRGEKRIRSFLENNCIDNISQKRFDDCKIKRTLPFDFYLPEYNICIEYQGKQHYKPIEFFGGEEQFQKQQLYDSIKREYCKANNIKLIEISYKDYNNIEEILIKIL